MKETKRREEKRNLMLRIMENRKMQNITCEYQMKPFPIWFLNFGINDNILALERFCFWFSILNVVAFAFLPFKIYTFL